ncbi:MAG: hypothetical protein IPM29_14080 [Planctomycetes bacterium]|nr:hypothetical protein [Planctomycetota bacterium]
MVALCLLITAATVYVGSARNGLRNPDEAHYAEQARSFRDEGRFELGFVRFHQVKQPAEITHPEDLYPPGNGMLLLLGWSLVGEGDFGSALPSMLIAALLLPLLTFGLARRLGASPPFAFGCGAALLFDSLVHDHAHQGLADLPLAAAVTGALLLALRPGLVSAGLAGLVMALGFWLKPAALLFLPAIWLAHAIAHCGGLRREPLRRLVGTTVLFGAVFAVAGCWWPLRNLDMYGDPLYSANKFITAAANDPRYDFFWNRKVFWAHPEIDLRAFASSLTDRASLVVWVKRVVQHVYDLIVVLGPTLFGGLFAVGAVLLHRDRRVLAALAAILGYCVTLSVVFAIYPRYLLPLLPPIGAVAWIAADRLAAVVAASSSRPLGSALWRRPRNLALLLTAVSILPGSAAIALEVVNGKAFVNYRDLGAVQACDWLNEHEPDTARVVVMSHEALRLRHKTGHRTVNTPWDDPEVIEQVVQHYGVDYAVQTHEGDSAPESNRFFVPYLERFGGAWERVELPPDAEFTLWRRLDGDGHR